LDSAIASRHLLRTELLAQRQQFMAGAPASEAALQLARHLAAVLVELEPQLLGLYWPHRSEFNASRLVLAEAALAKLAKSLPFAQRAPIRMHYRAWDGAAPRSVDDCGIPASDGTPVRPDVVLVPCVGFTAGRHRLGYGGGYFDRWLAQHPDVTGVGVAWSGSQIEATALQVQPHDLPLTLVVTERGVL
jgi:5,10-methenyltetrahydrofolate synthetase